MVCRRRFGKRAGGYGKGYAHDGVEDFDLVVQDGAEVVAWGMQIPENPSEVSRAAQFNASHHYKSQSGQIMGLYPSKASRVIRYLSARIKRAKKQDKTDVDEDPGTGLAHGFAVLAIISFLLSGCDRLQKGADAGFGEMATGVIQQASTQGLQIDPGSKEALALLIRVYLLRGDLHRAFGEPGEIKPVRLG